MELDTIESTGDWPFSTPRGSGATGNFGNPGARGGSLGGAAGPGGGGQRSPTIGSRYTAVRQNSRAKADLSRECKLAMLNAAMTFGADATFFVGGAGIAVKGAKAILAANGARSAALASPAWFSSRAGRISRAEAARSTAMGVVGIEAGNLARGYHSSEGLQLAAAGADISWRDFVPGFASARAYDQLTGACGW